MKELLVFITHVELTLFILAYCDDILFNLTECKMIILAE